jgi:hypothetical protein
MAAREEAIELVERFKRRLNISEFEEIRAIQCAQICVDEKFKSIQRSFGVATKINVKLMKLSQAYKDLVEVEKELLKL